MPFEDLRDAELLALIEYVRDQELKALDTSKQLRRRANELRAEYIRRKHGDKACFDFIARNEEEKA